MGDVRVREVNRVVYVYSEDNDVSFRFDKSDKIMKKSQGIWTVVLKDDGNIVIVKKEENSHTFFANKKTTKTWKFIATNTDAFRVEKSKTEVLNTAGYGTYAIFLSACVLTWYLTKE